jgi:hypothetical protein
VLQLAVASSIIFSPKFVFQGDDIPYLIGQIIGSSLFGIMGLLLLISAYRIKMKIAHDDINSSFLN